VLCILSDVYQHFRHVVHQGEHLGPRISSLGDRTRFEFFSVGIAEKLVSFGEHIANAKHYSIANLRVGPFRFI
jgi:hypothetical protein